MDKKYASAQENLEALANIFSNLLDILSMILGSQVILVFVLLLFMRKWKLSIIAFHVGVGLWILASCMDLISPYIREFAVINTDSEVPVKAAVLVIFVLFVLIIFLGTLMIPLVIGKIRKKKLLPIIGLFLMNFLIPVLYPFAMWLALKDDEPVTDLEQQ